MLAWGVRVASVCGFSLPWLPLSMHTPPVARSLVSAARALYNHSKCPEAVEPFFHSDACVAMAHATAACLRRARLAQSAERQHTFAAGEQSAAAWVAARALLHMRNVMLCVDDLPEVSPPCQLHRVGCHLFRLSWAAQLALCRAATPCIQRACRNKMRGHCIHAPLDGTG